MRTFAEAVLVVGAALWAAACSSPLSRSEAAIRGELLRADPPGTSKVQVRAELEQRVRFEEGAVASGVPDYPTEPTVGKSFLRAHLGGYGVVVKTDVVAVYYFDEEDKLLDVRVVKYREGT